MLTKRELLQSSARAAMAAAATMVGVSSPLRAADLSAEEARRILRGLYAGMSNAEILALDEPQDVLFRLEGGQVHRY
jgi:hypothetical protein